MFSSHKEFIFYILAIYLMYVSVRILLFFLKHIKQKLVHAEITDIDNISERGTIKFSYKVRYYIASIGKHVDSNSRIYSNPYLYKKGQIVKIYIEKCNINSFSFNRVDEYWFKLFFWIFQVPLVLIAILIYFSNVILLKPLAFVYIAIITCMIGCKYFINSYQYLQNCSKSKGQIIDYKQTQNSDNQMRFLALIEFQTNNGKTIRFYSNRLIESYNKKIGNEVKILYDNNYPEFAKEDSFLVLWLPTIFFLLFSLVSIIVFLFLVI